MFYLIARDLRSDKVKVVSNCSNGVHRGIIVRNYCINENIIFIENESDITTKCVKDEIFCCKRDDNEYIIIQSTRVYDGWISYGYVLREIIGYLDILEYEHTILPMSSLKNNNKNNIIIK